MSAMNQPAKQTYLIITVAMVLFLFTADKPFALDLSNEWGGHVKGEGYVLDDDERSILAMSGGERHWDGFVDFRLKDRLVMGDSMDFEIHYNAGYTVGDTYRNIRNLKAFLPFIPQGLIAGTEPDDSRRLFDLSHRLHQDRESVAWHRLDRLFFTVKHQAFEWRLGRQAVTWGNGLFFNPMDVMNPFSPTDTQREYKTGDDLASMTFTMGPSWDVQCVIVPRRDIASGEVEEDQSSLAVKIHTLSESFEMDAMAARHVDETMVGLGFSRNVGEAVFRSDLVGSSLDHESRGHDIALFLVANLDYSWTFFQKNMYGSLEYYHNGLGRNVMTHAITDPELMERIARGEVFVLGRNYLGGQIRVELHALVNFTLGLIGSLDSESTIVQPRVQWDMGQNSRLQCGANIRCGPRDTEFGGIEIPGTGVYLSEGNSLYLIWGYYF